MEAGVRACHVAACLGTPGTVVLGLALGAAIAGAAWRGRCLHGPANNGFGSGISDEVNEGLS